MSQQTSSSSSSSSRYDREGRAGAGNVSARKIASTPGWFSSIAGKAAGWVASISGSVFYWGRSWAAALAPDWATFGAYTGMNVALGVAGMTSSYLTEAVRGWLFLFKCNIAAEARSRRAFPATPWTILNLPDLPLSWQAQLVQQLSPAERLALFKCSHAAAHMVLQHAPCARLELWRNPPVNSRRVYEVLEGKTVAARRHNVAMRLAEGARDLKIRMCDNVLCMPPPCLHSSITALDICLGYGWDATRSLRNVRVHLPMLTSLTISPLYDLPNLLKLGGMFGHTITHLRLLGGAYTAEMLPPIAAKYPSVTRLTLSQYFLNQPQEIAEVVLLEWKAIQWLDVAGLRLRKEIKCVGRSWQQLDYHSPDWNSLACLPLEAFKRVVLHNNLQLPKDRVDNTESAVVLNKLRVCDSFQVAGIVHPWQLPGEGMPQQATFGLHELDTWALMLALEVLESTTCQSPSLCLKFSHCSFDAACISKLLYLPTGVSTLVFVHCQFRQDNEEQFWTQFAASLPAHVEDLAVQVETHQQAVALLTVVGRLQHLNNLWLYKGDFMGHDWQGELSQVGSKVRPNLNLHLMNCYK